MKIKYQLLKAGWGIVIFLDAEEILGGAISGADVLIAPKVYLRIDNSMSSYTRDIALRYMSAGLRRIADKIKMQINDAEVCFYIKNIDYNECHFQEEGLYCAIQEWIALFYGIEINPIHVEFDEKRNRYLFDF